MSEFSVPPLSVSHDSRWIQVPLRGDLSEWAQKATANYVAKRGGNEKQVRALLEGAGKVAGRADDAAMALILMPVAAEGIRALVRFCPVNMFRVMSSTGEEEARWSALLGDLTPASQREEAPEVTRITTKAGPCRRVVRTYAEGEGNTRAVGANVAYAWLFPQYAAGVVMLTAFLDLAEARRWQGALDELAASVGLGQAPVTSETAGPGAGGTGTRGIEIRPVQPDGRLSPADNAVLSKWRLRADPAAGTLTLTEDRALNFPPHTLIFQLPSSGRPDAVRTVCLASYRWIRNLQTGIGWRLLLLDGDGHILGKGRTRDEPRASQLWPKEIFEPLQSLGITVVEQSFNTEKLFKRAYPDL